MIKGKTFERLIVATALQHCMMHVKALVGGALVGAPHFASMPNSSERIICSGVRQGIGSCVM
eukprot:scaffold1428_cov159-Amphora_coffeaeformis.AAC.1